MIGQSSLVEADKFVDLEFVLQGVDPLRAILRVADHASKVFNLYRTAAARGRVASGGLLP